MTYVGAAHEAIAEALSAFRVLQPGEQVVPPAVVLGPPAIGWTGYGIDPTSISVPVWAVVANGERATESLYEHLQAVTDALAAGRLVITTARPGVHPAGGVDLPAYEITVEV